ncbi:hypothetical protein [Salinisphaera sp.]|uniref:hypothetical protein n=1 Tax=Salinisphaera sp. TaxID=1914330 RepID=UPI002D773AF8|nr:hypothetical protein [Salinisphaera sp.]HET7313689.1 hypothetical protein [Salinisphaera sp.]
MFKRFMIAGALALTATTAFGATFAEMDSNNDGKVTRDEYFGTISDWGTYSDWDSNGDGLINQSEFDAAPFDGDYVYWDYNNDGYLDSYEVYNGLYATYDDNDDGYWENGEWHDFDDAGLKN